MCACPTTGPPRPHTPGIEASGRSRRSIGAIHRSNRSTNQIDPPPTQSPNPRRRDRPLRQRRHTCGEFARRAAGNVPPAAGVRIVPRPMLLLCRALLFAVLVWPMRHVERRHEPTCRSLIAFRFPIEAAGAPESIERVSICMESAPSQTLQRRIKGATSLSDGLQQRTQPRRTRAFALGPIVKYGDRTHLVLAHSCRCLAHLRSPPKHNTGLSAPPRQHQQEQQKRPSARSNPARAPNGGQAQQAPPPRPPRPRAHPRAGCGHRGHGRGRHGTGVRRRLRIRQRPGHPGLHHHPRAVRGRRRRRRGNRLRGRHRHGQVRCKGCCA